MQSRTTRINALQTTFSLSELSDLWQYRELFWFLVWRDLLVKFRQTVLGVVWAILKPLAGMILFAIFFGRLAKMPSDNAPYALFAYTGLLLWTFFAQSIAHSANSLIQNQNLVTKIYFPRLLLPAAPLMSCLVDVGIGCLLLFFMLPYYGFSVSANLWAMPFMVLLAFIAALGAGIWLSALQVKYHDIGYVLPFLSQVWMFSSPVVYPTSIVPGGWRIVYGLNPMVGAIEGFRWSILGTGETPWIVVLVGFVSGMAILLTGVRYFKSSEDLFADVI